MSDPSTIIVERRGGVLGITLNRPDNLNALNTTMSAELLEVFREAQQDSTVRCVTFTGAGRGFCSGQDLVELHDGYAADPPMELGRQLTKWYNPVIRAMRNLDKPIIAGINGVAAGGGCGLALSADLRIASTEARFFILFSKIGLVPDMGTTWLLPRLVGMARSAEMAFFGDQVNAEQALAWGLINRVEQPGELADRVNQWADDLAARPTRSLALAKMLFARSMHNDLEGQLEYEAFCQEIAGKTADHREAVDAFTEKRPPNFTGR
jgi:2-(1,2-epoxy-1,2-dihydrophenyl)acetyl-CoA isomerase